MPTSRAATRIARRVFANSKAEEVQYNQCVRRKERAKQEEVEREETFRTTGRLVFYSYLVVLRALFTRSVRDRERVRHAPCTPPAVRPECAVSRGVLSCCLGCRPNTCVLHAGIPTYSTANAPQVTTHSPRACSLYPAVVQRSDPPHPPTVHCAGNNPTAHTYVCDSCHSLPILSPQRQLILPHLLDCISRPRAQHGDSVRLGVSGSPQETEGRHVRRRPLLSFPRHQQGRRHLKDR